MKVKTGHKMIEVTLSPRETDRWSMGSGNWEISPGQFEPAKWIRRDVFLRILQCWARMPGKIDEKHDWIARIRAPNVKGGYHIETIDVLDVKRWIEENQ